MLPVVWLVVAKIHNSPRGYEMSCIVFRQRVSWWFRLLGGALAVWVVAGCATVGRVEGRLVPVRDGGPTELILIVHGSGDGPDDWPSAMADAVSGLSIDGCLSAIEGAVLEGAALELEGASNGGAAGGATVAIVDWEDAASDRIVAPRRGEALGMSLSEPIRRRYPDVETILIISHSVGAFLAHGVAGSVDAEVHHLFLDPFIARSLLRPRYGVNRFGEFASVSWTVLNRLDPVPFTAHAPETSRMIDVSSPERAGRAGHWYPVDYAKRLFMRAARPSRSRLRSSGIGELAVVEGGNALDNRACRGGYRNAERLRNASPTGKESFVADAATTAELGPPAIDAYLDHQFLDTLTELDVLTDLNDIERGRARRRQRDRGPCDSIIGGPERLRRSVHNGGRGKPAPALRIRSSLGSVEYVGIEGLSPPSVPRG